jgi:hypothetical protein
MDRSLQIVAAFMAVTVSVAAQEATPATPAQSSETSSIILAPNASKPTPSPKAAPAVRPSSSAMAANISSRMPAYSPELSAPRVASSSADLRDSDKPKNQIPRLTVDMMQRYVVREPRPLELRRRDMYTTAALIDLSFKEHPGLRIGNIFNLNAKAAYNKIMDEERFADRQDLVDTTVTMAIAGDSEEMRLMQQAILDESFMSWEHDGPVGIR